MASKMKQDAADVSVCLYVSVPKGVVRYMAHFVQLSPKLSYYVPAVVGKINGDFRQVQAPACRALERIACASKTGARLG